MTESREGSAAPVSAGSQSNATPAPHLDAMLELVQQLHGDLTGEARERVRASIAVARQAVAAMNRYPLSNADEPDPIFIPFRQD